MCCQNRSQLETISANYKIIKDACEHNQFLNRVSIYPCCDKAYSCDECHNNAENHILEPSVIGYCRLCETMFEEVKPTCEGCSKEFQTKKLKQWNDNAFFRLLW